MRWKSIKEKKILNITKYIDEFFEYPTIILDDIENTNFAKEETKIKRIDKNNKKLESLKKSKSLTTKIDEATYNKLLNKNEVIDEATKTELSFIENNHLFKVSFYEDFTTLEFDRDDVLSLEELQKDVRIIEKLDGSLDKFLKNREKK